MSLQVDDLKQFRQWESKTPGHPENFLTPGVEVTTGTHTACAAVPFTNSPAMPRPALSAPLPAHQALSDYVLQCAYLTGPLGQGVGNAVGLAAAEAHLAARFNKDDAKIVDHYTYCIMGDGCATLPGSSCATPGCAAGIGSSQSLQHDFPLQLQALATDLHV